MAVASARRAGPMAQRDLTGRKVELYTMGGAGKRHSSGALRSYLWSEPPVLLEGPTYRRATVSRCGGDIQSHTFCPIEDSIVFIIHRPVAACAQSTLPSGGK